MARKSKLEPEVLPDTDAWMVTFSDLMSLMLTFFVLLISMSTLDAKKLKDISSEFQGALLLLDVGEGTEPNLPPPLKEHIGPKITPQNMLLAMKQHSTAVFRHSSLKQKVSTLVLKDRLILRIGNVTLFDPGSATLKPEHIQTLKQLAHMLAMSPGNIRIEGHGDASELSPTGAAGALSGSNDGSQGRHFTDAWSLALARAASVLHVLVNESVNPARLSLVGYGSDIVGSKGVTQQKEKNARHVDIVLFKPGFQ